MTNYDKTKWIEVDGTIMSRDKYLIREQQFVINDLRKKIHELSKGLPEDDKTRHKAFVEHAMQRLEVIHNRKKDVESSCIGF